MKIAVTGGNGFVGRNLISALPHDADPLTREDFGDFEKVKDWTPVFKDYTAVIHLAARVHKVAERRQNKDAYFHANALLTKNIAEGAARAGVQSFIFLSSAAIYGAGRDVPYAEDDQPEPQSEYAKSKLQAENYVLEQKNNFRAIVIRAPMIYGGGGRANFRALARAVKFHMPLPLAGVHNKRSFLSVDNLASFTAHALNDAAVQGVYNLSDGEDISTPDLVRRMAGAMGHRALLYPFPVPVMQKAANFAGFGRQADGLLGSFRLDIARALDAGWSPESAGDAGLKRALSGF